jgi:hypothetical protein
LHDFLGLADWGLHQEGLELSRRGRGEERGFLGPFNELGFDFGYLGRDLLFDEGVKLVYVKPGWSGFVMIDVDGIFSSNKLCKIELLGGLLKFLIFHCIIFALTVILKFDSLLTNGLFSKQTKKIKILT